ncbi:Zinc finger, RING-CH-type [Corchorus capsularis]|uniref:Zinc finger, RING-CH-type n=1 Tax=Corchorus capsularis TaxID=210143 RepID=A0A1R3GQZ9_COCAP|nr:Zinc finger, RING-CH-type [Corchorus capsularis]
MGDHFVLLVDRLLTESTLEAAIESRNRSMQAAASSVDDTKVAYSSPEVDLSSPRKIVECRICQDEDVDSNMETPCSCCGSLKYAHRRCVQRWCNEKGNTTCEICHQHFKPGYTAPPPLFQIGRIPLNLRGNWEISRRELNNSRFIAVVSTDRSLLDSGYDEHSVSNTRSLICYRTVAIIFLILLILRHTLPVILSGTNEYSFPLFMLLLLRTIGIILPIYVLVKGVTVFCRRRRQQETPNSLFGRSDEETEPHIINIP